MIAPPSPIDMDRIQDATGGDAEFLKELVDIFLQDAQARMVDLRRAFDARDCPELSKTAHKLKGSSANLGANGIWQLALTIEQRCHEQDETQLQALLEGLEAELARVSCSLSELVAAS